jgi:hypothetical protein
MESMYYVMTFLCHRQCPHCYEPRFHPYAGKALDQVVSQSQANFRRLIDNFPDQMIYPTFRTSDLTLGIFCVFHFDQI